MVLLYERYTRDCKCLVNCMITVFRRGVINSINKDLEAWILTILVQACPSLVCIETGSRNFFTSLYFMSFFRPWGIIVRKQVEINTTSFSLLRIIVKEKSQDRF